MTNYAIPVTTKIVPATPGTRAIECGDDKELFIGQQIIAWAIGIRQDDEGDIWPESIFTTPVTFSNLTTEDILGVINPDGSVDYGDGVHYKSFDDLKAQHVKDEKQMKGKTTELFPVK
jgi:hypothetical protein